MGATLIKRLAGNHDGVRPAQGLRPRGPQFLGTWNRLLMRESLVGPSLVVETHVLDDDAAKVVLAEDEEVIQQLSAQRAGQGLSEGIHVRRAYRGAHNAHSR